MYKSSNQFSCISTWCTQHSYNSQFIKHVTEIIETDSEIKAAIIKCNLLHVHNNDQNIFDINLEKPLICSGAQESYVKVTSVCVC